MTSSIALYVASRGATPLSSQRSTFSTTTIASSTTMQIASTSPNSEMLFRLKPTAAMTANVPMIATGMAIMGISTDRQFCRKTSTTRPTNAAALQQGLEHVRDRFADERRGVVGDFVVHALGKSLGQFLHLRFHPLGHVECIAAGKLEDGDSDRRVTVERHGLAIILRAHFDASDVAQANDAGRRAARLRRLRVVVGHDAAGGGAGVAGGVDRQAGHLAGRSAAHVLLGDRSARGGAVRVPADRPAAGVGGAAGGAAAGRGAAAAGRSPPPLLAPLVVVAVGGVTVLAAGVRERRWKRSPRRSWPSFPGADWRVPGAGMPEEDRPPTRAVVAA